VLVHQGICLFYALTAGKGSPQGVTVESHTMIGEDFLLRSGHQTGDLRSIAFVCTLIHLQPAWRSCAMQGAASLTVSLHSTYSCLSAFIIGLRVCSLMGCLATSIVFWLPGKCQGTYSCSQRCPSLLLCNPPPSWACLTFGEALCSICWTFTVCFIYLIVTLWVSSEVASAVVVVSKERR